MAYEPELLPLGTALYWEEKTKRVRCIAQRGAAFFLHYTVPFHEARKNKCLTRQRGATFACEVNGLSHEQTAEYLEVNPCTVRTHAAELYNQLGISRPKGCDTSYYPLRSLARLAQLKIVELARPAELLVETPPIIFDFVNGLLQGRTKQEVGAPHDLSADNVKERLRHWRQKAGFDNTNSYAMHLLAAGKVGQIEYNPALMDELPTLLTNPHIPDSQLVTPTTNTVGAQ